MRKLNYLFVALVVLLSISACDKLPTEVKFDHTYTSDFDIDIPAGAKAVNFDVNETLDPMSSKDFKEYADLIKDVTINGIDGLVAEINKDVTITDFFLKMTVDNDPAGIQFKIPTITFQQGSEIKFESNSGQFAILSQWLKSKKPVTIQLTGTSSEDDVQVKFTTKTGVTVKADPLNN